MEKKDSIWDKITPSKEAATILVTISYIISFICYIGSKYSGDIGTSRYFFWTFIFSFIIIIGFNITRKDKPFYSWLTISAYILFFFSFIAADLYQMEVFSFLFSSSTYAFTFLAFVSLLSSAIDLVNNDSNKKNISQQKSKDYNRLSNIVFNSIIFLVFTPLITFITFYNPTGDNSVYTSIMSVFASIVGGSITLIGIAWTIKNHRIIQKETLDEMKQDKFSDISFLPSVGFLFSPIGEYSYEEFQKPPFRQGLNNSFFCIENTNVHDETELEITFSFQSIHFPIKEVYFVDVSTRNNGKKVHYVNKRIVSPIVTVQSNKYTNPINQVTIELIHSPLVVIETFDTVKTSPLFEIFATIRLTSYADVITYLKCRFIFAKVQILNCGNEQEIKSYMTQIQRFKELPIETNEDKEKGRV